MLPFMKSFCIEENMGTVWKRSLPCRAPLSAELVSRLRQRKSGRPKTAARRGKYALNLLRALGFGLGFALGVGLRFFRTAAALLSHPALVPLALFLGGFGGGSFHRPVAFDADLHGSDDFRVQAQLNLLLSQCLDRVL